MLTFLLRRALLLPLTFVLITGILYAILMLAPVDARAELYIPRRTNPYITEQQMRNILDRVIREHGLNDPFPVQYVRWLGHLAGGDWGWSPALRTDVIDALIVRTPATLELTLYTLLFLVPLGLISGVRAGWKGGRGGDRRFRATAYVATSIPPFILGFVLLSVFYVGLHWFPPGRMGMDTMLELRSGDFHSYTGLLTIDGLLNLRLDIFVDGLRHLALPVVTLGLAYWALLGRITRAGMVEVMSKEYMAAASARGLRPRSMQWRHAFLNVAPPSLATIALTAASLITGVFVIETVFNFPGISELIGLTMLGVPDIPLAMGFAVYSVLMVLTVMFILDIVQAFVNPLVRRGARDL
ncbi:MAG: ABC transporter permease [Caldilineales bacterium]|nr:ABC transporter permease [Caldilineales bacterium]